MKALLLFSAVAGASVAAGLGAQVTAPKADSACTNYPDGRVECRVFRRGPGDSLVRYPMFYKMDSAMAKRAALGLELRTTGTRRDTLGVFVEAVTPKGPAELAGIVEGDRIAAINGVDLRTSVADTEDSYTNGLASHRLTREVQKLAPGARVTLRVYSGGRFRDVSVTAGKASDVMRLGRVRFGMMPGMDGMMEFDGPGMRMFSPDIQLMRERMPMIRKQMQPQLRERLNDLPYKIRLRTAPRVRTMAGEPGTAIMFDDTSDIISDIDEPFVVDFDEPFEFEEEIEPVNPEVIRELAATAARDARVAIEQLAADGIA